MDEIQGAFLTELLALLLKYEAVISAEDHWTDYAETGSDIRITVERPWPAADIDLGKYADAEKIMKMKEEQ